MYSIGKGRGIGGALRHALQGESFIRHIGNDKLIFDFHEGSGTVCYDKSHNSNNGTFGAEAAAPTWQRNSLYFDGIDDYVNCGLNGLPSPSTEITIALWVKPVEGKNTSIIIANPDDTVNRFNMHFPYSDNIIYWDYGNDISTSGRLSVQFKDSWFNVMAHFVFISSTSGQKIYRNSILIASDPTYSAFTKGTKTLDIARYAPTLTYWKGTIDEVRIISKDLSGIECQQEYLANKFRGNN